jgi:hypothetical protein
MATARVALVGSVYQLASYGTKSVACRGSKEEASGITMAREIEHVT